MDAVIITICNKCYNNEIQDLSGDIISSILQSYNIPVSNRMILPEDFDRLKLALNDCIADGSTLVITTGGTGFAPKNITPEATAQVIDRVVPGISEAIRLTRLNKNQNAMLDRGICGIKDNTLIVNLPSSPEAVKDALDYIMPTLAHGIEVMLGNAIE